MTVSPGLRKLSLTAHVVSSLGWLGAIGAFLALAITGLASEDAELVRAVYLAAEPVTWFVIVPLAAASLLTGVVQSLVTTWGLLQHYWVIFKLAITVFAAGVLLLYTQTVESFADLAADPSTDLAGLRTPSFVLHAGVALVLLVVATALAVYKPRGRTRRGWRKQQSAIAATVLLCALALTACGASEAEAPQAPEPVADEGAAHIHGLGINPADGSLFIATHTGMFRAAEGESRATRVGDRRQDTMGFTVVGPDTFLGSGHPDARDELPPLLGLIRSDDAGASWEPVSLLGEADFHVLRAAGDRVYGFDATQGRLMVSSDRGKSWEERRPPAGVFDLAIDPRDADHVLVSTERGLFLSEDGGARWRPADAERAGLLAWTNAGLTLVDGTGAVHRSRDGERWSRAGDAGGQPAALAAHGDDLYLALHSNEVRLSRDGGRTWTVRAEG